MTTLPEPKIMVMTLMVMTERIGSNNGHDVMRVMTINGHDEETMVYARACVS